MVRVLLIILLVALQAVFGVPELFYGSDHYLLRALLYSFFHANWWHLAVNGIAVWAIFAPQRKIGAGQLLLALLLAVLVYPVALRPILGFSNILYALLGLRTPSLSDKWWRQPAVIAFIVLTIAMVFIPRFSATTHIAAFILGMLCAAFKRFYQELTKDVRRYL